MGNELDSHWGFDMGIGFVVKKLKVLDPVLEEIRGLSFDLKTAQGSWGTGELKRHLLPVVLVDVDIPPGPHKLPHF
jgi:hypothetical protein